MSDNSGIKAYRHSLLVLAGGILLIALGIASVVYYRERVLYLDSAYYAFNFINQGFPAAEHKRYALWLYQLIPWAFLKACLPLKYVLICYSFSHILLHGLVFLLMLRLKQYRHAALLALMQVIGYRECFFLAVNETALGISAVLLLSAYLNHYSQSAHAAATPKRTMLQGFIYFGCILTALFSHPTAMLLIPFVIVYHFLLNPGSRQHAMAAGMAFVEFAGIAASKLISGNSSGYEADLFSQIGRSGEILSGLGNVYSFNFFFGEFKTNAHFFAIYWIPAVFSVLAFYGLFKNGNYRLLAYHILSYIGLWLLIVVMFNRGDGTIFMEKNFTPWILLAFYPALYLTSLPVHSRFGVFVYTGILLFSMWGIFKAAPMYQKRLWLMDQLITIKNPTHASKLLLQDSTVNHDEWLGIWALPYETLLLSAIKGMPNTTAKIYHNELHINKELHRPDIFLGADFIPILPDTVLLNQRYFKLEDRTYVPVEYP